MSLESVNTLTNRDIFAVELAVELHMELTLSSPGYHRLWLYSTRGFCIHDGTLLQSKSQYTTVRQTATLGTHVHVRPARSRNTNS
jgi:hypothetical protein